MSRIPETAASMTANEDKLRDYLKRVTSDLSQTRRRLREAEDRDSEPIAIIGMSCRYPGGVSSPDELWRLVAEGRDAIGGFPTDRGWDVDGLYDPEHERPGTTYAREGGFLYDVADFDAAFFGISPREVLAADPQQRLLLETAWEAFEHAGIDPATVRGSRTGVFVGVPSQEYTPRLHQATNEKIEGYVLTGAAASVASGRIAYTLGLEGPAVTVDTACSSSLVALHLAVQSLRSGESDLALAGGVTVMAQPGMFVEFSRQRGLAGDGRCKSFAASADGTGWAEGAGLVLVERLSDAQRLGHEVLAVVRGSAVNQDGTSSQLSAPSGPAQQRVIRQALANAGLTPDQVDAVEAHGTGTTLGDPIEAQALLATYGQGRAEDRPLWLGSVKSNIGHSQAAAGVAGVIKMVEAIRHGVLPKTLHVDEPSPHVDWSSGAVRLLEESVAWPEADRPRRAAISAFGISGTNAHVLVEQAPAADAPDAERPTSDGLLLPWVLSGRGVAALRGQAARLVPVLEDDDRALVDVAFSLATSRASFSERAVVVAADRAEVLIGLDAVTQGVSASGVVTGSADVEGRTAFVFPGQGSQWVGMAVELLGASPVFAASFERCEAALGPWVDWSLSDVVRGQSLDRVDVVQPALWAVLVSLAELWQSFGVAPDAVVGHSQGEIAAAYIAGALSLEDAARVVALRSKAIAALAGTGGMASIAEPVAVVEARIAAGGWQDVVSVAAVNGPSSVVVSGQPGALADLVAAAQAEDVRARVIPVDYASHSAQVEAIESELLAALADIQPRTGWIPMLSTVTGEWIDTATLDATYWYTNLRQTVRFEEATRALLDEGFRAFIEVSPHPVLTAAVEETVEDAGDQNTVVVGSLRRDEGGWDRFLTSLAAAYVRGIAVDWSGAFAGLTPRRVNLPTYAFQRSRYWLDPSQGPAGAHSSPEDAWRHHVAWRLAGIGAETGSLEGNWLLLVPSERADDTLVASLEAALTSRGAEVRTVVLDLATADRHSLAEHLVTRPDGVVSLLAFDTQLSPGRAALPKGLAASVALVQALDDARTKKARLWHLTRGAVAIGPGDAVTRPVQALVWGFAGIVADEIPGLRGGLLDLPEEVDDAAAARVAAALAASPGETELAVRASGTYARRLVRAPLATVPARTDWTPSGTVLVTGGTGALGGHIARWLAGKGAEHLLLLSARGGEAPGAAELTADLRALGAEVTFAAVDVADRDALATVLDAIPDAHRLTAVVHTAAILDDALITDLTPDQMDRVLRVKGLGALNLHELTLGLDLSAFVLFSSVAGVTGIAGQGNYAPGNAFLDALAAYRRAEGLPATSIGWGHWAGGGIAAPGVEAQLARRGLTMLPPQLAVHAFGQVLDRAEHHVVVCDVDWPVLFKDRPQQLISELPRPERVSSAAADPSSVASPDDVSGLVGRLTALSPAERERVLLDLVRTETALVLGHGGPEAVAPRQPFREIGIDSLTAVELRNVLSGASGVRLPSTLVFDHPTPEAVARLLLTELLGDQAGVAAAAGPAATAAGSATDEPIAIVAMACRFPGDVDSPEELWRLVAEGVDAVTEFPTDRGWDVAELFDPDPDRAGRSYSRHGAFLRHAADFDAEFFGITPREALAMDPQQRLLLETAWEVLERAGIDPDALRGSRTGVFAGISNRDYASSSSTDFPDELEGYLGLGTAGSVASGRIAYTLGLEGPAVTVDTACSSSLVALHLAVQSLRSGESDLALAGGVTVMSSPQTFLEFSRQRAMSVDGRCKAFAASADGAGWAEGVGLLLVERLADARRLGHEVLAVVRGSAVNQDGASNGLTAPNGPSQQRVIRQALANAGLTPGQVDVVEAHGTGTALGDPIEAQALLATYGQDRPADRPLWLGSIKSNIAHTQAAAGVAGVIKMVEAIRHGVLPKTLHIDEPSPHVDWTEGAVRLLSESREWPDIGERDEPRRAGVSAFGVSGTNAHVVIEQAPAGIVSEDDGVPAGRSANPVLPWVVSAKSGGALREQAGRLAAVLEDDGRALVDVAFSLTTSRAEFPERAVVVAGDRANLLAGLSSVAEGESSVNVLTGSADVEGRTAFVFPGQGSQWVGMAVELLESSPVFAASFELCEAALRPWVDWLLSDVVRGQSLDRVDVVQPALWAVLVSLAELWQSFGVAPDAVVGHSQGEIAAAYIAGALSLEDAARVVALRSKAIAALAGTGGMASIAEPASAVEARIASGGWQDVVSVAAVNGPSSVVVSGQPKALADLVAAAQAEDVRARLIPVDYASHSAQVEAIETELLEALAGIQPRAGRIPMLSTVTGEWVDTATLDATYWYTNLRQTVRFEEATRALLDEGFRAFIEVSPHPVLTTAVQETIEDAGDWKTVVVGSLRRDEGGWDRFLTSLAAAYVRGIAVDWSGAFSGLNPRRVDLPTYAFQRSRYWLASGGRTPAASREAIDARFWETVRAEDPQGLAAALGIADEGLQDSLAAVLPTLASWWEGQRDRSAIDSWRYRVRWRRAAEPASARLSGDWLLVVPAGEADGERVGALRRALVGRGANPLTVAVEPGEAERSVLADRLEKALAARESTEPSIAGVVSLLALDESPHPRLPAVPWGTAGSLVLVQALDDLGIAAQQWLLTQGAVTTGSDDPVVHPGQARVWGLGGIVAAESPGQISGLIDLPTEPGSEDWERVADVLAAGGAERDVAVRASGVYGRRLTRAPFDGGQPTATWQPRGTTLITGGTGALGTHLARWVARRGAEHILLLSRRGAQAPGTAELEAELTALGTTVTYAACDVGDRDTLAAVLAAIPAHRPLTSVFHTAAILDDALLPGLTLDQVDRVERVKAAGALNLHELTRDLDLSAFVFFSSASGTCGIPGQGNYAPGNAFLDALAAHRRANGLVATTVGWGHWAGGGIAAPEIETQLARYGLTVLPPEPALSALGQILDGDDSGLLVVDLDWTVAFRDRRQHPLVAELLPSLAASPASDGTQAPEDGRSALARQLAEQPESERQRTLVRLVRAHTSVVQGHPSPDAIDVAKRFRDQGVDSLTAVELRNRLSTETGLRLPATLVFDHPTPTALATYLGDLLAPRADNSAEAVLAEIDRLEAMLGTLAAANAERSATSSRLRELADRWADAASADDDGAEHSAPADFADEVSAADDDELIAFIGKNFGIE
jgi:acyl transferase domain-containing protein